MLEERKYSVMGVDRYLGYTLCLYVGAVIDTSLDILYSRHVLCSMMKILVYVQKRMFEL